MHEDVKLSAKLIVLWRTFVSLNQLEVIWLKRTNKTMQFLG